MYKKHHFFTYKTKKKYQRLNNPTQDKSNNIKRIDYGLAILRTYLAFLVLSHHIYNRNTTKNKIILYITQERMFHVPSFYIMSFYFLYNTLSSFKIKLIIKRLIRLLIPYIGWAIIFFEINHILNKKYNKKYSDTAYDLKIQILWGFHYIPIFYYQWVLIVNTFIFAIIIFVFRKYSIFILHILFILSYALLYSRYLLNYINRIPNYKKVSVGSLLDLFPLSVSGYTLGAYKILNYLHKYKIRTLILSLLVYNVVESYFIFANVGGIFYPGVRYNIKGLCVIFIFSIFPSEIIKNKYISKFIIFVTNYTAGVYYLHMNFNQYLAEFFNDYKKPNFTAVIIEYILCYYICFFGTLIFGRTPLKYLFC